jgi:hypothetical protein
VSADNQTAYQVFDAAQQHELGHGFGLATFGLPVGPYSFQMKGQVTPVTIEEGTITNLR